MCVLVSGDRGFFKREKEVARSRWVRTNKVDKHMCIRYQAQNATYEKGP